ncbi:hypothetical protein IA614_11005 [Listeria seeligeri]|uniref:hypothetical protein n=1 Tax=Listeria seeligeri TaxID=1640 RepID=UPI001623B376|nr:hypothetical protein [Listeria seeligeri]MBC1728458.1 hypothetical protein [Listeria seeligeri]MBC1791329.1 hypothetical protein [Listeria seeligeri]MBC1847269.1 hypothetical protein [Listeria seeligeri]MBC1855588.1 hypothetical protein [Listeria seeligeri]MBF2558985.1 hypothetical protein [Listeria seeligeri]
MSEPSTMFGQFHITKEALQDFLQSKVKNKSDYNDWQDWWGHKNSEQIRLLEQIIDRNTGNAQDFTGVEYMTYDETMEVLVVNNMFLTENYEVMVHVAACWRGISPYLKGESKNNFLLIYPYWWGDEEELPVIDLYIEFTNHKSRLLQEVSPDNMKITQVFLDENGETLVHEYSKKHGRI